MKDEELAKYLPKYGDRVAVFAFSKRQSAASLPCTFGEHAEKESKRTSLIFTIVMHSQLQLGHGINLDYSHVLP